MATTNQNKAAAKALADKAAAKVAAAKLAAESKTGGTKIVKVPALSVVAARDGFRRAGLAWSREATVVKLSDLSEEQVSQIEGEDLLTVTEVEVDEEVAA